ncbi:hypothetical protein D3C83_157670 [compost metagenome]
MRCTMGLSPMNWLPRNTSANIQFTAVGFHLMKVLSCNSSVAPPSSRISRKVMMCIFSILCFSNHRPAIWIADATMAAAVAT